MNENNYVSVRSFRNCNLSTAVQIAIKYFLIHKIWYRLIVRHKGKIHNEFNYKYLIYNLTILRRNIFPYKIIKIKEFNHGSEWTRTKYVIEHFNLNEQLTKEVFNHYKNEI